MSEKKDLMWILNKGFFPKLRYGKGLNVYIVDTGVFIDIESAFSSNGHTILRPAEVLTKIERDYPLLVTSGVMREIMDHRNMKINNRDEISEATSVLAYKLFENTFELIEDLNNQGINDFIRDYHRYHVWLAAYEAFKGDSRKGEKDKISRADIEMIATAMDLSLAEYNGNPIKVVNILSPDVHISRTFHKLKECDEFKNYSIRAIQTRNDLRSYLNVRIPQEFGACSKTTVTKHATGL